MKWHFCPFCFAQLQVCHSSTPFLRDGFYFSLTVVVFHNRNHLPESRVFLIISSSSSSIPTDSVEEEVEAVLYETRVCEIQIGGEKSVSYRRSLGYEKEEERLKILVKEIICKEVCVLFFYRCSSVHCLEVSHRLIAIQ
ncbi:hypothetical protein RchiOBHm_Chr6g0267251 [Rosa chinensis]|uniref:Uncharacterized protein n=1 Tax=Rosa chinensis TaxID=74649 RepID=A0A2P6PPX1_ROSCH|nr:hypothetical protein RchiOBHm_Chr6g0267251 [Rosa chinensis]